MAALPPAKRISREDIREAPAWVDRLIHILNDFMQTVYAALNRNLSFGENVIGQIKDFTIKGGTNPEDNTFTFSTDVAIPKGVVVVAATQDSATYTPITAAIWCSWRVGTRQIIIDSITGLTAGATYKLRVLVI